MSLRLIYLLKTKLSQPESTDQQKSFKELQLHLPFQLVLRGQVPTRVRGCPFLEAVRAQSHPQSTTAVFRGLLEW